MNYGDLELLPPDSIPYQLIVYDGKNEYRTLGEQACTNNNEIQILKVN